RTAQRNSSTNEMSRRGEPPRICIGQNFAQMEADGRLGYVTELLSATASTRPRPRTSATGDASAGGRHANANDWGLTPPHELKTEVPAWTCYRRIWCERVVSPCSGSPRHAET